MLKMAYDLSKFTNIINLLNDTKCRNCKVEYDEKWCNVICFFCTHFNPWRDTYSTILKELYCHYIKSGTENHEKKEYYTAYLDNLHKWCNKFNIVQDEREENYIINVEL